MFCNTGNDFEDFADFLLVRRRLAEGAKWGEEMIQEVLAKAHGKETSD